MPRNEQDTCFNDFGISGSTVELEEIWALRASLVEPMLLLLDEHFSRLPDLGGQMRFDNETYAPPLLSEVRSRLS